MRNIKFILLINFWICSYGAWAIEAPKVEATLSEDLKTTSVKTTLTTDYSAVATKLMEGASQFLMAIPGVTEVSWLTQPPLVSNTVNTTLIKRSGSKSVLVRFSKRSRLPESLFTVQEEDNLCNNLKLSETDCPLSRVLEFRGPVHSYPDGFEWTRPETLNRSFAIRIEAKPEKRDNLTAGTCLTIQLDILSRSYLEFFRKLHETGRLPKMPVEKELQGIFALAMQRAIGEFAEKISK